MSGPQRLSQIDALRGIAAIAVVLFHFTTKFDELYGHAAAPLLSVPWGHLGVNLFFMISGFVIFMTLARTRTATDFLVSRFSRLYPAYWAAVGLTFAVVLLLGLPGKQVSASAAALNLLMFHGLFRVPNVDGVYWTLLVELIFYAWSLLAFQLGLLKHIHRILWLALALRLSYFIALEGFDLKFSWTLSELLILPYIAWFACGIMVYRLTHGSDARRADLAVIAGAVLLIGVVGSWTLAALALAFTGVLYLAASGRLPLLHFAGLIWLGEISYTLYLLHENIGWALMLQMKAAGFGTNTSIALALLASLALAWGLTRLVEKPSMAWIRDRYKARQAVRAPQPQ